MNVYTRMPKQLKKHFIEEYKNYRKYYLLTQFKQAWYHLERAHILGQQYPFQHTFIHWKMLQFGFKIKSLNEILGQIPRLFLGGIKSFVGIIPIGNTGGANIPALKTLPIPKDLNKILSKRYK